MKNKIIKWLDNGFNAFIVIISLLLLALLTHIIFGFESAQKVQILACFVGLPWAVFLMRKELFRNKK